MDKGQVMRFSKEEIKLLKKLKERRENVFLLLRDHFLQLELTEKEDKFIKSLFPEELKVLRKGIYFELLRDVPLTQQATMYAGLNLLEQLHPEMGILLIKAQDLVNDYVKQQFDLLENKGEVEIKLSDLIQRYNGIDQKEIRVINTIAYNKIIPVIEGKLMMLESLTNQKEETEEQRKERLKKDSSK